MTREQFDQHVRQLEQRFRDRPLALRLRIAWLTCIGYAIFGLWFLVIAAIGGAFIAAGMSGARSDGGLIGFGVAVVIGGMIIVGRMLWVSLGAPAGHRISRAQAPALFALLSQLRSELQSQPFHRVLVDGRCNASVAQVPRLGVFGWNRNYLVLGLPLLDAMSAEELRAVLAHECAHLSRQHGRFNAWIYRLRRSWEGVFAEMARKQQAGGISMRPVMQKIADWFWPRFHAHAFVLSRANEYEADATAGRVAGPEHMASALLRTEYYARLVEEKLWPEVWLGANSSQEPPPGIFETLRQRLRLGASADDSGKWVEQAFRAATTNADTHPSMSDRLRALQFFPANLERGVFPPAPNAPRTSAAEALLGNAEASVRAAVSETWQKECATSWREVHARAHSLQHRLAGIERHSPEANDADSLWDKAQVTMQLQNAAAAVPLLQQILALQPAHAPANFCLGRHLLSEGDEVGESFIERALSHDESLVSDGCEVLLDHHRRHGREDRIRELLQRMDHHEAAIQASHVERSTVSAGDVFIPHEVDEKVIASIAPVLSTHPEVRAAYVARKQLRHFPAQRLFVVVLETSFQWAGASDRDATLCGRLHEALALPGRTLVVTPRGFWKGVARKVMRVPGSEVYRKAGKR